MNRIVFALLALAGAVLAAPASAQVPSSFPSSVILCDYNPTTNCIRPNGSGQLPVAASTSGSASNASDGQATSSTNVPSIGFNYLYNGTTWDRQRGDTTAGAWVNVKGGAVGIDQTTPDTTNRVSAGTINSVCVTPTITANTYSAGQEVGGLMTFANAFNTSGRGIIQSIAVDSKTKQTAGTLRLYTFVGNPSNSTWTDRGTPAINAADVFKVRTPIDLPTPYYDLGTHTVWGAFGVGQAINAGGTSLYAVLVATSALSAFGSTSDIQVCIKTLAD